LTEVDLLLLDVAGLVDLDGQLSKA